MIDEWNALLVPVALLMVNLFNRILTRHKTIDFLVEELEERDQEIDDLVDKLKMCQKKLEEKEKLS